MIAATIELNCWPEMTIENRTFRTFNHGVQGSNPCGLTTFQSRLNTFKGLCTKLANLSPRLANVCSLLFFPEGLAREFCLIGRLRVSLDFSQALMTADRRDLMLCASGFR